MSGPGHVIFPWSIRENSGQDNLDCCNPDPNGLQQF